MSDDKTLSIISAVTGAIVGVMAITPLVEQVTKTISPKLEQLVGGENNHNMSLLTDGKKYEQNNSDESDYKKEKEKEIEELKRQIAELEDKEKNQHKKQGN